MKNLWKKYKRNTNLLTEEEKEQLSSFINEYGLL